MGALGDGVKEVDWVNSRKSVRQYLVMNWIWPGRKEGKRGGQGVQGGFREDAVLLRTRRILLHREVNKNTEPLAVPAGARAGKG